MKNIFTIMKKELKRFFGDRRMLLSLILPGIVIFIVYSLMGSVMGNLGNVSSEHNYNVYVCNQPDSLTSINVNNDYKIVIHEIGTDKIDEIKDSIKGKVDDLLIVYDENFDSKVSSSAKPNVQIFYNSTNDSSNQIYGYYVTALNAKSIESINYSYYVNNDANVEFNLATKEDVSTQIITMIVPYVLIIILFTGCMSIATESIAGEKERGTIATLLVTPTKRSEIALGKILALSITALASSLVSFLGLILSVPRLMGGMGDITLSMYGPVDIILVLFVIMMAVIFFIVVLSIISALAKSIKEASSYAIPVMVITMLVGLTSMLGASSIPTNPFLFLIPIYNLVMSLTSIFGGNINVICALVTIISNVAYIALGVFVLTRIFNNEKLMFNK